MRARRHVAGLTQRSHHVAHVPGPHAALSLGALLVAAGELPDPFPPPIGELARAYFERFPPEVKA